MEFFCSHVPIENYQHGNTHVGNVGTRKSQLGVFNVPQQWNTISWKGNMGFPCGYTQCSSTWEHEFPKGDMWECYELPNMGMHIQKHVHGVPTWEHMFPMHSQLACHHRIGPTSLPHRFHIIDIHAWAS